MKDLKDIWDIRNKYSFMLTPVQKRWGIVVAVMTVIGAFFDTLGISVILPLVQVMISPDILRGNRYAARVLGFFQLQTDQQLILLTGAAVILTYLVKNIYLAVLSYVRVKYACKVQRELSLEMMSSYMRRGYLFFKKADTGELLRGMTVSIENTFDALLQILRIFAEALTALCICIFIMAADFWLAAGILMLAAACLYVILHGFRNFTQKCGIMKYKSTAAINRVLLQAFGGIKEVLVMNRQSWFWRAYKKKYVEQQNAVIGQTIAQESPIYLIEGVCVAGLMLIVCVKAINAPDTAMLIPQLASFAVAAFRILPSLGRITSYFNRFITCIPNIYETWENLYEVRQYKKPEKETVSGEMLSFTDKITVENVVFSYEENGKRVLDGVSLSIPKGSSTALTGQSGAGKSTLADMMLGLLKPQSGTVKADGADIYGNLQQWSRLIGYVPQSVFLIDDSVRKNVAFGIPEEEIDESLVWHALEQASLKEFVRQLPKGLDTSVGEKGIQFSGGQIQRIAIARALYTDPAILILDEATSALDGETEALVMDSIEKLKGEKTLIMIAHRLSTIQGCDAVYEIRDGKAAAIRLPSGF